MIKRVPPKISKLFKYIYISKSSYPGEASLRDFTTSRKTSKVTASKEKASLFVSVKYDN